MMTPSLPEATYLREALHYDPLTGTLTWRTRPDHHFPTPRGWRIFNTQFAGLTTGCLESKGYLSVRLDCRKYWAHRLIWKIVTGEDPGYSIDHRDRDRANNRWTNLREASRFEQSANSRKRKHNSSGFKGVSLHGGKWRAQIRIDGVSQILGSFPTPAIAHTAYMAALEAHFGEYASNGEPIS